MEKFIKVRFVSGHGATAGLVMTLDKFSTTTISGISRLFPVSEFRKMGTMQASPALDSFEDAFSFQFDSSY